MDLNGLYSALRLKREGELRVKVWLVPVRLVRSLPTRACGARILRKETGSSARSLRHNPPQWDSNPRLQNPRSDLASRERRSEHNEHEHQPGRAPTPTSTTIDQEPRTQPVGTNQLLHRISSSRPFLSLPLTGVEGLL